MLQIGTIVCRPFRAFGELTIGKVCGKMQLRIFPTHLMKEGGEMSVYDQAVQMIHELSNENVVYLIDFMQRFMKPEKKAVTHENVLHELEAMRIQAQPCFPADFDAQHIWEEAMDEKYGRFN
jgi:hypothetical protein